MIGDRDLRLSAGLAAGSWEGDNLSKMKWR